jgi:hypothetical protein
MQRLLCCVLIFLFTAFAPEPIRITYDEGGTIDFYLYRWASYPAEHVHHRTGYFVISPGN